jgi:ribosomal protein S27E
MKNKIKIEPLSDDEAIAVLKLPKFNTLKPVKCDDCGNTADFSRKIFSIIGVKKDKNCDDEIQTLIRSYISKKYGVAYVFFKSTDDKFYADSACCPNCQSTKIIFDIELTNDVLSHISKLTGKSIEELRRGIEATAKVISGK